MGDSEVKGKLARALNRFLAPMHERMSFYEAKPGLVDEIIWNGTLKMRRLAAGTMGAVRQKMGLDGVWKALQQRTEKAG
ncbi:MAG: hypothetical protein AB9866_10305 [Syntrophobacteraceae bacterium]